MSFLTHSPQRDACREDILHISVGDSAFEILEGMLNSNYALEFAHRCGVHVNDCGDFFVSCNLVTGTVNVCATYYPPSNEAGTVLFVDLEEEEKRSLLKAMETHCQKHYKKDAIQILNDERKFIGLPPVQFRKPALNAQIADATQISHLSSKDARRGPDLHIAKEK